MSHGSSHEKLVLQAKAAQGGSRWSTEDINRLDEAVRNGMKFQQILAIFPDRSNEAIYRKIGEAKKRLAAPSSSGGSAQAAGPANADADKKFVPWSAEDIELLNDAIRQGKALPEVQQLFPTRSEMALRHRIRRNKDLLNKQDDATEQLGFTPEQSGYTPGQFGYTPEPLNYTHVPYTAPSFAFEEPSIQESRNEEPPCENADHTWSMVESKMVENALFRDSLSDDQICAMFPRHSDFAVHVEINRIRNAPKSEPPAYIDPRVLSQADFEADTWFGQKTSFDSGAGVSGGVGAGEARMNTGYGRLTLDANQHQGLQSGLKSTPMPQESETPPDFMTSEEPFRDEDWWESP